MHIDWCSAKINYVLYEVYLTAIISCLFTSLPILLSHICTHALAHALVFAALKLYTPYYMSFNNSCHQLPPQPPPPLPTNQSWVTKLYRTKKFDDDNDDDYDHHIYMREKERKSTPGNTFSKWKCINFPYWLQMDFECHIQLVDLPESLNQTMDTKTWDYYYTTRQKDSIHRRK